MKTLKVLLQEVVSGIKAWVNSNFAQESNAVHKTGNETVNGVKTFSSANILSEVNRVDKGLWFNGNREVYLFPEWTASYSGLTFASESIIQTFKFGDWKSENNVISFNYDNAYFSIGAGYYSSDNKNKVEITPRNADDSSVGTSTYQWNNVYAKNYYYNGTAWGLDKENTWTQNQIIESNYDKSYCIKDTAYELGQSYPNGEHLGGLIIYDKNSSVVGIIDIVDRSYGSTEMRIRVQQKFDPSSNNRSTSGTTLWNETTFGIASDKTNYVRLNANLIGPNHDLGTSTNKWKSLNGINPGALSFPKMVEAESRALDRTNWDYTGTNWNTLDTSAMTGWGYIYIEDCGATDFILIRRGAKDYNRLTQSANPILDINGKYYLYITFPIVQNTNVYALIKTSGTVTTSVVYPCQGTILSS